MPELWRHAVEVPRRAHDRSGQDLRDQVDVRRHGRASCRARHVEGDAGGSHDRHEGFADLSQDLLLKRCRAETVAAIRYEGSETISASLSVLGQIAMRGLMTDPAVTPTLEQIEEFVDKDAMRKLAAEAGVTLPAAAK